VLETMNFIWIGFKFTFDNDLANVMNILIKRKFCRSFSIKSFEFEFYDIFFTFGTAFFYLVS
jgi:hypothetical protein